MKSQQPLIEAFLKLLQLALWKRKEALDTAAFSSLTPAEWTQLVQLSIDHTMPALMADAFEAVSDVVTVPQTERRRLALLTMQVEKANQRLNDVMPRVFQFFKEQGYDPLLLKGQGIASLYPNPLHRTCGDIDLWCKGKREDLLALIIRHFKEIDEEVVYHHMEFKFDNTSVEVHFHPSWFNNPFVNHRFQQFVDAHYQNRHLVTLANGFQVPVADEALNVLLLIVHIYRHVFKEGIGLRQVADVAMVLSKIEDDGVRAEAAAFLSRFNLSAFSAALMWIMTEKMGMERQKAVVEPNAELGSELFEEILMTGNFGKADSRYNYKKTSPLSRFIFSIKHNFKFVKHYPDEVLWYPFFKIGHYSWRRWKGYLKLNVEK